ncbi:DUF6355 family natural product biosynthesis protein [Allokutzneria sp. NRRL B-24872]|uniref:DUF6355 family natural product biosynthesis protein n=1 Tax=Allokutzneria sp. NRRL B-24872 TaxID=1137961 RepID=UPI001178A6A1|nr:DUF6355 family natural product biosynthesis protein [Allokutzneria sp. NRRL B-24872]
MKKRISAALAAVATLATLGTANTASASANETQRGDFPCGYYSDWAGFAFYGHCGSGWVQIRVEKLILPNEVHCVGPGTTRIGYVPQTRYAVYLGKSCKKPGS